MRRLFDPFGVSKGLRLEEWYRAQKEGKLLPPVQACVNPVHGCNLSCLCCEFTTEEGEAALPLVKMPEGHLVKVVDMLADWGVKSVTFGTVGEPTLHRELATAIIAAGAGGMDVSVITNGVYMPDDVADSIASICSSVWVKIPAADAATYQAVTRRRFMGKVMKTPSQLAEHSRGRGLRVGWLFEMNSLNFEEVVDACWRAKDNGYDAFYARPVAMGMAVNRQEAVSLTAGIEADVVTELATRCEKHVTGAFTVAVVGKLPQRGFHQCYAAPLTIHIGADGNVYFCHDRYGDPEQIIGVHYPDPNIIPGEIWGGEAHQQLLHTDTPYWCEVDCSLRPYHLQARALVWETADPLRQWQIIR